MGACQNNPGAQNADSYNPPKSQSVGPPKVEEVHTNTQRSKVTTMFAALKLGAPSAVVVGSPNLEIAGNDNAPMYNTLKYGFNRRFQGDANWILVCRTAQDVVNAVQLCVQYGMRPTVGSGYHCYENFVQNNPTGMLIDVSMMDNISTTKHLSTDGTLVTVEPGCYNWKIALQLFKLFGKLLPGGSCYSVCAGGHICGGGYGISSRLHGLTVDYVHGVEVVTADEQGSVKATTVTRDTRDEKGQDLLWACRGGGGQQLGIITKYYFKLDELPPAPMDDVFIVQISVDWNVNGKLITYDQFKRVIDCYAQFWADADKGLNKYWDLFTLMHAHHAGLGSIAINCQANEWASMQALLDHLDAALAAATVTCRSNPQAAYGLCNGHRVAHMQVEEYPKDLTYTGKCGTQFNILKFPWLTATQFFNGNPSNSRFKNTGSYHTKPFTDYMVQILYKYLTMQQSSMPFPEQTFTTVNAEIQIDSYGGKINTFPVLSAAVAQRSSIIKCQPQIYWNHPQDDDINLWWISNFTSELYRYCPTPGWKPEFRPGEPQNESLKTTYHGAPKSNAGQGTDGGYFNYPDICIGTLQKCYAPIYWPNYSVYSRLQKAKKEWDSRNLFNSWQSISRADSGDGLGPMLGPELFEPSTQTGP